ncbi:splicing factor, partial [Coemansia sp. RSA 2673]
FYTLDSAIKAVDLSGKRLLDVPIIVQPSEAEKNRQATMKQYSVDGAPLSASEKPSTTLVFVRELAVDIESGDLKAFFDLFGKVEYCHVEPLPGSRAEWSAFVKYDAVSSARHAADKMNGLPLFGARLRVRLARRAEEDSEIRRADEERAARKAEEEREARRNSEKALPPPATTAPPAAAVLCLRNAFGPEDQVGDDWRLAVAGRVRSACEAHGAVEEIRTVAGPDAAVFVRYTAGPAAEAACRALNARALGGHTLSASLASMEQFNQISA